MNAIDKVRNRFYPEIAAGGFSRVDGTVAFYQRINALITPASRLLDIGAGRGVGHLDDPVAFRRQLRSFRGRVAEITGIDVAEAVLSNPSVDHAAVIENGIFPVPDNAADLAFADFTLEHVDDVARFESEVRRVVQSGGWFCARTPNKFGYVALASRLAPEKYHKKILSVAQPSRKEEDVFPAFYKLNTRNDLRRIFSPEHWDHFVQPHRAEPAYFGSSPLAWTLARASLAVLPPFFWPTFLIFLRRR